MAVTSKQICPHLKLCFLRDLAMYKIILPNHFAK